MFIIFFLKICLFLFEKQILREREREESEGGERVEERGERETLLVHYPDGCKGQSRAKLKLGASSGSPT